MHPADNSEKKFMTESGKFIEEIERIRSEYHRRKREIPRDFYSLERPGNLFIYTERLRGAINLLRRHCIFPLREKNILGVGCGSGNWLVDFESLGAERQHLHGIDLDKEYIEKAKGKIPQADLRVGSAAQLPWPDRSFDIVLQSTLFTSILDPDLKKAVAQEMTRVVKNTGVILWYDFFCNNPWNPNVRGITKKELKELFPNFSITLNKITLAAPLARWLAPKSRLACYLLEQMKLFNTHYLAILRVP